MANLYSSRLHADDGLLRLLVTVKKEEATIDSLVCALLALGGPGANQTESPPLELVGILRGKVSCVVRRSRLAEHLVIARAHRRQTRLDERDREIGQIDTDPMALKLLSCSDGSTASAERV